ncbi:hypothetical protein HGA13_26470 [Nocardia speluncae]|uniref:Uncharacterized protein n=1 Tax=Nocardia speluncae TaxID=419477 RepID=A0A846XK34_9NOCA|nr:hypothetical protein [Nocardia speluncae]NKY36588.1 hypothetical protein [Nocardia speluncae]
MRISAGAPGWYDACTPDERADTVALAKSRRKWSVVWSGIAASGVALAVCGLVSGVLPVAWPVTAVPRAALGVALVALLIDLAVLVPNGVAWLRVEHVFSGRAPDEVVRPFRRLRWVPTSLVSLLGTLAMLTVGIHPLAVLGEHGLGGLSFLDWLTAVVAVLCVLCGLSTMWLKVILRPVRTGP